MKKIISIFVIGLISINAYTQNKFELMPDNMIKYIGKTTQSEFEKLVGEPVGYEPIDNESNFTIYEVEPIYGKDVAPVIAIRCYFRESDGILIGVKFPSQYPLAYWINFSGLPGYKEKLHSITKKYLNNRVAPVNLKLCGFGCQILDWQYPMGTPETAVINYHIV